MRPGETEAQMLQRNLERMQKAKEEKDKAELERKRQELEKKKTELEHKREVRRSARIQAGAIVRKEVAAAAQPAPAASAPAESSEKITHLTKDRPMVKGAGGKSRRPPTRGHHKKVCVLSCVACAVGGCARARVCVVCSNGGG
jgi:hypothetical protein